MAKKNFRKAHKKLVKKSKSKKLHKVKKHKKALMHKKAPKKMKKPKIVKKLAKKNKKLLPVKFFHKKKATKAIIAKAYTYIPTTFKVYTPIQTYSTFIYYTQPIGFQIFYNDLMTEYTTCQYVNGISLCEKVVSLPLQFSVVGHLTYFGINLDKC